MGKRIASLAHLSFNTPSVNCPVSRRPTSWRIGAGLLIAASLAAAGCDSLEGNVALGTIGATVLGGRTPSHEIEQTYYFGVFDEQEQVKPEVYRVRLHGQASLISTVNFASGWLPAAVVDSLGTTIQFNKATKRITVERDQSISDTAVPTGRKLILFGPEGFRRSPKDHRLVVVMGSSPESYFDAVNQTLGTVAAATQSQGAAISDRELFNALVRIKAERERLAEFGAPIRAEIGGGK